MIIDASLQFDSAANLAQAVGTYPSANVIDLGLTGLPTSANGGGARDIGIGDKPALKLFVLVTTAFVSAGGGVLAVGLQSAIDNGSGAPGAWSATWWQSPNYTIAQLKAGATLYDMDMPRPPDGIAIPRFLRMVYIIATATITAGNIQSEIVLDRQDQAYSGTDNSIYGGYQAGINVAN